MNGRTYTHPDVFTTGTRDGWTTRQTAAPHEPSTESSGLLNLVQAAARLVQTIGDQAARDEANYRRGWHDAAAVFFNHGVTVGRLALDHELTEQDRRRTEYIAGLNRNPAYAELERRRWDGRRQDFGKPRPGDFPGTSRRQAAA